MDDRTRRKRSCAAGYLLSLAGAPIPFEKKEPVAYLTFASAEPFTIGVYNAQKNWDGTLYYSTDTANWNEWDGTTAVASAEHNGEQAVYMRGTGNTKIAGDDDYRWVLTGSDIRCDGNIENLLDYAVVAAGGHPQMDYQCYGNMFLDCTSLTKAPDLPATVLESGCYFNMFSGCTNLTKAPDLPAAVLTSSCYASMFSGCTNLKEPPKIQATTMEFQCCCNMFERCASLTKAPELPATELSYGCYMGMFRNCASLTDLPDLPATTLASDCYRGMFEWCTGIRLSTTQTDEYWKPYRIPMSGDGNDADRSMKSMFTNTGGTFTGTPEINTTYYIAASEPVSVYE